MANPYRLPRAQMSPAAQQQALAKAEAHLTAEEWQAITAALGQAGAIEPVAGNLHCASGHAETPRQGSRLYATIPFRPNEPWQCWKHRTGL